MSDYKRIYLQPECCADPDMGRLWCQDDGPEACPEGEEWTPYVLASEFDQKQADLDRALARVAELRNLCERLQHCAQGFYVDQGDYGHMEAIMKDYHRIMRASKPWRDAFISRIQAEAVEAIQPTAAMKAEMLGAFKFTEEMTCSACHFDEPDNDCEVCGGDVTYAQDFQIPWTSQKQIIGTAVAHVAQRLRQQAEEAERPGGEQ